MEGTSGKGCLGEDRGRSTVSEMAVRMHEHRDRPVGVSSSALDHLTELAGQALGVPVACASLVDADRRLLTSSYGLSAPWALLISWSFTRRVVATGRSLVVRDGRRHPQIAANPAVRDGTVVAYVGVPLVAPHGRAVGALSVMDPMPRRWSTPQLELLRKFAARIVGVSGFPAPARKLGRVVLGGGGRTVARRSRLSFPAP